MNEKAKQEPVAWMCSNDDLMHKGYQRFAATPGGDWNIPVYTAPQGIPKQVGKFAKFTDGVWREVTDSSPGVLLYELEKTK